LTTTLAFKSDIFQTVLLLLKENKLGIFCIKPTCPGPSMSPPLQHLTASSQKITQTLWLISLSTIQYNTIQTIQFRELVMWTMLLIILVPEPDMNVIRTSILWCV